MHNLELPQPSVPLDLREADFLNLSRGEESLESVSDVVAFHFKNREEDRYLSVVDSEAAHRVTFEKVTAGITTNATSRKLFKKKLEGICQKRESHPSHKVHMTVPRANTSFRECHGVTELSAHRLLPQEHHEGIQRMEHLHHKVGNQLEESIDIIDPYRVRSGKSYYGSYPGGGIDGAVALAKLIWIAYKHNNSSTKREVLEAEINQLGSETAILSEQMGKLVSHITGSLALLRKHNEKASEQQQKEIGEFIAECEPILHIIHEDVIKADDLEKIVKFSKFVSKIAESSENADVIRVVGQIASCIGMMFDYQIATDVLKIKEALLKGDKDLFDNHVVDYVNYVSDLTGTVSGIVNLAKFSSKDVAFSVGGIATKALAATGTGIAAFISAAQAVQDLGRDVEKLFVCKMQIDQLQEEIDRLNKPENAQKMSESARLVVIKALKARQEDIKKHHEFLIKVTGLKDVLAFMGTSTVGVASTLGALTAVKCVGTAVVVGAVSGTLIGGIVLTSIALGLGIAIGVHKAYECYEFRPITNQSDKVKKEHEKLEKMMLQSLDGYPMPQDLQFLEQSDIDEVQYRLHRKGLHRQITKVKVEERILKNRKMAYMQEKFSSRVSEHEEITSSIKGLEERGDTQALIEIIRNFEQHSHHAEAMTAEALGKKAIEVVMKYVLKPVDAPELEDLEASIERCKEARKAI